jgi:predicted nucleotidyltransferase
MPNSWNNGSHESFVGMETSNPSIRSRRPADRRGMRRRAECATFQALRREAMESRGLEGRNGIDASVLDALYRFARALNQTYDDRVRRLVVFGSRARGEAASDSDVDVAVVLDRMAGRRYDERMRMTDLAYEILLDTGLRIQAWPISRAEWDGGEPHPNPTLLGNIRRDAVEIGASVAA